MPLTVTWVEDRAERSKICREILAELEAAEEYLLERGIEFLQVKTLGPSRPNERYERTRGFYEARGFVPIEEFHGLWEADNPTLILVKHLACR
jgi:hypothetical protein